MRKPTTVKSVVLPLDLSLEMEEFQEKQDIRTFSDTVTKLCKFAIEAYRHKGDVSNPDYIKSLEEIQEKESIFEWVKTLPASTMNGFKQAIEMEMEERAKRDG